MSKDISRICDKLTAESVCTGLKGNYRKCKDNVYGVILTDVWLETKMKNQIYESWGDQFFVDFHEFFQDSKEAIEETKDMEWFKAGFINPSNYKLLAFILHIA